MGTDCTLKVDDKWHSLDRWYVFYPAFVSAREQTVDEALGLIRQLKEVNKQRVYRREYCDAWVESAEKLIKQGKNTITFYSEHDIPDEYIWQQFHEGNTDD